VSVCVRSVYINTVNLGLLVRDWCNVVLYILQIYTDFNVKFNTMNEPQRHTVEMYASAIIAFPQLYTLGLDI